MSLFTSLGLPIKFLSENEGGGAVSSTAVATSSDSIARVPATTKKVIRRKVPKTVKLIKVTESSEFDSSHVSSILSKLSAANVATADTPTKDFGFQDSEGNIIKVSVEASQADEFKQTLAQLLADYTDNEQDVEVAEVLFNLRNKYNIVDVVWPKIIEDEEPVQAQDQSGDDLAPNADNPEVDDVNVPAPDQSNEPSGESVAGAMDAMISALIADAEARRQEAVARAAEARAKEADAAARMSAQKMSAEEEVADMEAFYTSQNEEQKEAKKLAKLAKYRHQMRKSQQDLKSTAYDDALDAQEDDNFMGIDTGEDEKQPELNNQNPNSDRRQPTLNDPTSTLDKELKPEENEENSNNQHNSPSNLLKALLAMRKTGVRV